MALLYRNPARRELLRSFKSPLYCGPSSAALQQIGFSYHLVSMSKGKAFFSKKANSFRKLSYLQETLSARILISCPQEKCLSLFCLGYSHSKRNLKPDLDISRRSARSESQISHRRRVRSMQIKSERLRSQERPRAC